MSLVARDFCGSWGTLLHLTWFEDMIVSFLHSLLRLEHLCQLPFLDASDMSGVVLGGDQALR